MNKDLQKETSSLHFSLYISLDLGSEMNFSSFCKLAILCCTVFPNIAKAESQIIPSLGKKCFTFEVQNNKKSSAYDLEASHFTASLVGTGLSLSAQTLHISDKTKKMTQEELSRLNALAAYLALSGHYHGISPYCPGLPYPELVTIAGKLPAAEWENITMERPFYTETGQKIIQKIFIKNLKLQALEDSKNGIRGIFDADHISGEHAPLTPQKAGGDFTFTPNIAPPYKIIVRRMEGIVGESKISGTGYVLAGQDISHSKSKAHLSISHIGSLINQASSSVGPQATAALLLARLFSHREEGERVSWDIELDNGASKVNDINIPYFVH